MGRVGEFEYPLSYAEAHIEAKHSDVEEKQREQLTDQGGILLHLSVAQVSAVGSGSTRRFMRGS